MSDSDTLPPLTGVRDPIAIHQWAQMASSMRQALLMLSVDCPSAAVADLRLTGVRHAAGLEASGGATTGPIQRGAHVAARCAHALDGGQPLTPRLVAELGQAAAMLSDWSGELVGRHAAAVYPVADAADAADGVEPSGDPDDAASAA